MAMKVAFAAALLVALVAVASATTFTTTTYDRQRGERQQECRQQLQGRQFQSCQNYLKQRSSSPFEESAEEEEANPRTRRESPYLEQCCEQLKEMDRNQCGCEAIRVAVEEAQQGGRRSFQTGQSSEQLYERARDLPRQCNLREQQCSFNLVFV